MVNIDEFIKNATLSKDKVALNAYKNIKAKFEEFKYAQILPRKIDEDIALRIIANYIKKVEDTIKQYSGVHRDDSVAEYTSELEVIRKLLPEPVNESQIYSFIQNDEIFFDEFRTEENICIPKKEMEKAIKYLKSKFPTADGKMISDIIKKYIV